MKKKTNCVIHEIEYFKHFDGKNSLYLIFNNVDEYIEYIPTHEDSETKYLVFSFMLNKFRSPFIETINSENPIEYGKDFIKARFESNDDLPLSKI